MAGWDIRIDDDDDLSFADEPALAAELLHIKETLNGHEEARFRLANNATNRAMIASDHDVRIQFGGTTIFYGRLTGAKYSQDWLEVIVYNKVYEKARRTLFGDPATGEGDYTSGAGGWSDTEILEDICVKGGWTRGTSAHVQRKVEFDNVKCWDALKYLSQITDQDFWTGDENARGSNVTTINYGSRGTAKGTISVISVSDRGVDRAVQRDKVVVIGWDPNGNRLSATSGTGAREVAFREKHARDTSSLQDIADRRIASLNTESSGVKVRVSIGTGYNIFPGDTVTLDFPELKLPSASYRVFRTVKSISSVELQADRSTATLAEHFASLRNLEDIGIYQHGAETIPQGLQTWSTNLEFRAGIGGANKYDAVEWDDGAAGNAEIRFADGTVLSITAGSQGSLAASTTYYVYATVGSSTLTLTTSYVDLDDPERISLAKLRTPPTGQTTREVEIQTYYARGDQFGTDFITDGVIVAKDFRTAWNVGLAGGPAGIRFNSLEIAGYSAGTTKEFYLQSSDGKAYFGGGTCILDVGGLYLKADSDDLIEFQMADGTKVATIWNNNGNLLIMGNAQGLIQMRDGAGVTYISIDDSGGVNDGRISIYTSNAQPLIVAPSGPVEVWSADLVPRGTLGDLGSSTYFWEEGYIDNLTVGDGVGSGGLVIPRYSGADPTSPVEGEIWLRTDL